MHLSAHHHQKTKDLKRRPLSNSETKNSSPLQRILSGYFIGFRFQWIIQYTQASVSSPLDFSSPCPCCCALRTTRLHGDNSTYCQEQIEISVHGLGYSEITLYQTHYSEAGWRCVSSCFLPFNIQLLLKVRNPTRLGSHLLSTWDRQLCSECCSPDWTKITAGRTNYF